MLKSLPIHRNMFLLQTSIIGQRTQERFTHLLQRTHIFRFVPNFDFSFAESIMQHGKYFLIFFRCCAAPIHEVSGPGYGIHRFRYWNNQNKNISWILQINRVPLTYIRSSVRVEKLFEDERVFLNNRFASLSFIKFCWKHSVRFDINLW